MYSCPGNSRGPVVDPLLTVCRLKLLQTNVKSPREHKARELGATQRGKREPSETRTLMKLLQTREIINVKLCEASNLTCTTFWDNFFGKLPWGVAVDLHHGRCSYGSR